MGRIRRQPQGAERERVTELAYEKCKADAIKEINTYPMENVWSVCSDFSGYSKEGSHHDLDSTILMCRIAKDLQGTGIRARFVHAKSGMDDGSWHVYIVYSIVAEQS